MAEEPLPETPRPLRLNVETGGHDDGLFALLVCLAEFAGWTLSRSTMPPRVRRVNLLGAVGILAFFFSVVSPDDDAFQQELIRLGTPTVTLSAHTRVAPRRSPADLSITAFADERAPFRAHRRGRSFVVDGPLALDTHFRAPIPIHSPPAAS
jgi:hypothetical protein